MRFAEVTTGALSPGLVLAPERYVTRGDEGGVPLLSLASLASDPVKPGAAGPSRVLDTGDALAGFVRGAAVQARPAFRSAKRRLLPGDVIVSRLRPYLRQVAFVDAALFAHQGASVEVVASSEFYVLRSPGPSLAFLVPWLLSEPVQALLAGAQEGGHHPRVPRSTLSALRVPASLVARRRPLSRSVEAAVAAYRQAEAAMEKLARAGAEALSPTSLPRPRAAPVKTLRRA